MMTQSIGIDIGSQYIKLIVINKTSRGYLLNHIGMKKIPYGLEEFDIKTLSSALRTLIEEIGIKTRKVNLAILSQGTQLRRLTMPYIPKKELLEAIHWEMKNYLPFPIEEVIIKYHILDKFVQDNVKKLDLLVVASPLNIVEKTIQIASEAGLEITHLDSEGFALWNSLIYFEKIKIGENIALIDFGASKTKLYLFKDGILQFNREFTPGGNDLTRSIMEGLNFREEPHSAFEKAEKIKEEVGIPQGLEKINIEDEPIDISRLSFSIRPILERWVSEINRSFEYIRSQFYREHIDRILICGGGSYLKNLRTYLQTEIQLPVEQLNPLEELYYYDVKTIDQNILEHKGSFFFNSNWGFSLPT